MADYESASVALQEPLGFRPGRPTIVAAQVILRFSKSIDCVLKTFKIFFLKSECA